MARGEEGGESSVLLLEDWKVLIRNLAAARGEEETRRTEEGKGGGAPAAGATTNARGANGSKTKRPNRMDVRNACDMGWAE